MLSLTDIEYQVEALDHCCMNLWIGQRDMDIEEKDSSMLFLIVVPFFELNIYKTFKNRPCKYYCSTQALLVLLKVYISLYFPKMSLPSTFTKCSNNFFLDW